MSSPRLFDRLTPREREVLRGALERAFLLTGYATGLAFTIDQLRGRSRAGTVELRRHVRDIERARVAFRAVYKRVTRPPRTAP